MSYTIEQLEEEWNEVYCIIDFKDISSEVYSDFWDCKYYQTYGGGPEGGFLVQIKDEREIIYEVERNWGEPWCITELPNAVLQKTTYHHDKWNTSLYVKL